MITFNEHLVEATYDIDNAVDYVYDKFFRDFIENLDLNNLPPMPSDFGWIDGDTFVGDVNNKIITRAHEIHPLSEITSDTGAGNVYRPSSGVINVTIPSSAYSAYRQGIVRQLSASDQRFIKNELTEARIKGTIMHEISHWINDSIHNFNIYDRSTNKGLSNSAQLKRMNKGKNRTHQFLTDYELDAQLHAILQYIRANKRRWDSMTFGEALAEMPFYNPLSRTLTRDEMKEWKRYMYTRMARENILGNRMKRARSLDEAQYDYVNQCVDEKDSDIWC
ncbi:hypothetical protein PVA8_328 [Vibrio phage PVA8]|nr:hypothetical protein [Vibrio phage PC-Liy1]URQ03314.1 hypothetical protein PVA8_328 [Vibrio phage PVA8]WBM59047.1 hypothetical protein vBValMPVA8_325 [Vibrio phage vB_ValM_PVA8]